MGRERFSFEGIESIEKRLRRVAPDVAYLIVWDRTERRDEETLARFDLTVADALPYLNDAHQPPPPEDDDGRDDDDEGLDEYGLESAMEVDTGEDAPVAPPKPTLVPSPADITPEQLAIAAGRWLRDLAIRNTIGEPYRRFRVRAYAPKGARTVDTGSFICRNDTYDLDLPDGQIQPAHVGPMALPDPVKFIPPPSFENVETASTVKGMRALGDYYAQWGRIVLGSVSQLQGVNNQMLGRMHRQLDASRGHVDELLGAILNLRAAEMELAERRRASDHTEDTRAEIAKQALQQLGDAAKAFLAARGVSPEMADVLGTLSQSPDLMSTLNDPDVRALMQDANNLKALAAMLKGAAEQGRAAREAQPPGDTQAA